MAIFEVEGGHKLKGDIIPQGAKNEALQILCAVLLTKEKVIISNIPNIVDINKLIELLSELGVKVEKTGHEEYTFQADDVNIDYLVSPEFKKKGGSLRGSMMIVGPMLTRFGKAYMPKPGGDKIGRRRLDTHFEGFVKLGATFNYDAGAHFYAVDAKELKGTYIHLDEASVTGTANVLMAAVLAKGTTTIYNAACEPYLQQLCKMLNSMGAKISGIASNMLTMTKSEITIKDVSYDDLGIIPDVFRKLGIIVERKGDDIFVPAQDHYEIDTFIDGSILTIADAPWPGFTPDLLSIILVVATQAKGSVLIHQKMFESRLFFVDKLIDMGAQIILCDPHRATVIGLNNEHSLKGISMTSPDIRAGVSLLIAALSAKGKSTIHNIEQIDRGYQDIDIRLRNLGADIRRIS
jgi:UDP-N-acetylglucosamine 1-carboxyvinyltransferase